MTKVFGDNKINPDLLLGTSPYREKLLIAMPGMSDGRFAKSVIYLCAHSSVGAMGVIINQPLHEMTFPELMEQLKLPKSRMLVDPQMHYGGPVDASRGFVLHSDDYSSKDTAHFEGQLCLTGTMDILRAMTEDRGPRKAIFALGYAGWGAGQLDAEMQDNSWLTVPADMDLLFETDLSHKWEKAMARIGINPGHLSMQAGHA